MERNSHLKGGRHGEVTQKELEENVPVEISVLISQPGFPEKNEHRNLLSSFEILLALFKYELQKEDIRMI